MHDCPGNQRNLESQDGNGSYHDNNTVAIRDDRSRGIRWLLIAESVREGMSTPRADRLYATPRASAHELGDCPCNHELGDCPCNHELGDRHKRGFMIS